MPKAGNMKRKNAEMHLWRFETKLQHLSVADDMTFAGYGAVFENVDSYGDVIVKGAFSESISRATSQNQWPIMLSQHGGYGWNADDMTPVGVWLSMSEDDFGLKVSGKLAPTARGNDLYTLLNMAPRPAIDGLSIGYIAKTWERGTRPDEPRRKLTKVDLVEISLVTFPANLKARVTGLGDPTIYDAERALVAAGMRPDAAKSVLAGGWAATDAEHAETRARAAEWAELANALRRNIDLFKG